MHTIQQYEKYKDSGIAWIGEIPEHWKKRKLNSLLSSIGSGTTPKEKDENGDILWLNTGDLNDSYINTTSKTITQEIYNNYSTLKLYTTSSIVIAMYGATIGKLGIINTPMTTNQACCVMQCSNQLNNKFLFYLLFSIRDFLISLSYGAGQPNINQEIIKAFKFFLPPLSEQEQIADYLDKKCALIDESIEKNKASIEKLKEYKQAIITEAVTKGLNKSAPLKNSNIEWIGQIPEHWEIRKIKSIIEKSKNGIKIGPFGSALTNKVAENLPYNVYGQANLVAKNFSYTKNTISEDTYNQLQNYKVISGDICISMMGTIGKAMIVPPNITKGIMDSHIIKLRLNKQIINSKFFIYCYDKDLGKICYNQMQYTKTGSIMSGLNTTIVKQLYLCLPPLSEQKEIAAYLDKKCAKIDTTIQGKEKLIEKLTEYKKSLIFECVTGKRKVAVC